jgi:hypothetical protein
MDQMPEQKPLFPKAWPFFNSVVASIGAVMILLNILVGAHLWSAEVDKWLSLVLSILTAIIIWLNERRRQLFGNGHSPETATSPSAS